MAETDFVSFLVDETFKLHKSRDLEVSSFEHKLSDYKLEFLKGEFIPQLQTIRFITPFGKLDFPVNWSVFNIDSQSPQDVIITSENDQDHLLQIFQRFWNGSINRILMTNADGFCYFVGLKSGEEVHIADLLNVQEWFKAA